MAFATPFDALLRAFLYASVAAFALSAVMLIAVVVLRVRLAARERLAKAIRARWRPLLARAALGEPVAAATVHGVEGEILLALWNEVRESVGGEFEASLDAFGRRVGLDRVATGLFAVRGVRRRLLAINTLGRLGTAEFFAPLDAAARERDPVVSLAAARALLRLDAARALPRLLPLMLERADWSVARLVAMLRTTDLARLELVLAGAFPAAQGAVLERLLLLAAVLPQDRTERWARRALRKSGDEAQLAAALRLVGDPHDAPIVRHYLRHPSWQVRVRAVTAMERVAAQEDLPRLVHALTDREWWVRLRAARTLVRLPFMDRAQLARLGETVSDRFARDALRQAIAEERPA